MSAWHFNQYTNQYEPYENVSARSAANSSHITNGALSPTTLAAAMLRSSPSNASSPTVAPVTGTAGTSPHSVSYASILNQHHAEIRQHLHQLNRRLSSPSAATTGIISTPDRVCPFQRQMNFQNSSPTASTANNNIHNGSPQPRESFIEHLHRTMHLQQLQGNPNSTIPSPSSQRDSRHSQARLHVESILQNHSSNHSANLFNPTIPTISALVDLDNETDLLWINSTNGNDSGNTGQDDISVDSHSFGATALSLRQNRTRSRVASTRPTTTSSSSVNVVGNRSRNSRNRRETQRTSTMDNTPDVPTTVDVTSASVSTSQRNTRAPRRSRRETQRTSTMDNTPDVPTTVDVPSASVSSSQRNTRSRSSRRNTLPNRGTPTSTAAAIRSATNQTSSNTARPLSEETSSRRTSARLKRSRNQSNSNTSTSPSKKRLKTDRKSSAKKEDDKKEAQDDDNKKVASNDESSKCCICLEIPTSTELAKINGCSHPYCFSCIEQWAKRENTCPQCKARFSEIIRVNTKKSGSGSKKKRGSGNVKKVKDRDQRSDYRLQNPLQSLFGMYDYYLLFRTK